MSTTDRLKKVSSERSPKPKPPEALFENIPDELRDAPQWVVWRYVWNPDKKRKDGSGQLGDWDKPPSNGRTGGLASSTDKATWCSLPAARAAYQKGAWDGVGIVLTGEMGIVGIDLDNCREPETGKVEPWAQEIIDEIKSYAEVSPSGRGLRIFAKGAVPGKRRKKGDFEIYAGLTLEGKPGGRYLTVTGQHLKGTPEKIRKCPKAIARVYEKVVSPPIDPSVNGKPIEPSPESTVSLGDEELLRRAKAAKNGDKFARLWAGDRNGYPSASEADLALCSLLSFWTGPDSDRIDQLFRRSGLMRPKWDREDYRRGVIAAALSSRTEFYSPAREADGDGNGVAGKSKDSQATQLVQLVLDSGCELWHDPAGDAFITLSAEDHRATWAVQSRAVKDWASYLFYTKTGKSPGSTVLQDALTTLRGRAKFDGPEHPVYVRLADHEDRIYLDLCNDAWQAIEISPEGWRIVDDPPVKFRRAKAMLPLSTGSVIDRTKANGAFDQLRQFVNVKEADRPLLLGWLVAAMRPRGPYPVLCLHGEQGSAKSTTSRVLRSLIDPSTAPVRAEPREARDLGIAANNGWVIALDNLSWLRPWLSDALCRLSTGGGFATRTLYENDEETIFDGQRPIILNGIEEVATRGDLLDRSVLVTCPTIPEAKRRPEAEFWSAWERTRPRVLAALLDAVSVGLRNLPDVKLDRLPRMADFATWAVACEPALGLEEGAFLDAYLGNVRSANELALEGSIIAAPLRRFLEEHEEDSWTGTASELLDQLTRLETEQTTRSRAWPKRPNALGGWLRRLAPNLRKVGIYVRFSHDGKARVITLRTRTKVR